MKEFEDWFNKYGTEHFESDFIPSDLEYYKIDVVKAAFQAGQRKGLERAIEIAEKSSDFCDLYCSSGEYMAMVDVRDKIIKAIRKELKGETND